LNKVSSFGLCLVVPQAASFVCAGWGRRYVKLALSWVGAGAWGIGGQRWVFLIKSVANVISLCDDHKANGLFLYVCPRTSVANMYQY